MAGPSALPKPSGAAEKAPVPRLQTLDIMAQVLTEQLQKILAESLNLRIQSLPQELQDHILDFTIAVEPNEDGVVEIDESYKPPVGLQLNRKIREAFAKQYYGVDTVFQYLCRRPYALPPANDRYVFPGLSSLENRPLIRWIASLESEHRLSIATIRLDYRRPSERHLWPASQKYWVRYRAEVRAASSVRSPALTLNKNVLVWALHFCGWSEWYRPNAKVLPREHRENAMLCHEREYGKKPLLTKSGEWYPQ